MTNAQNLIAFFKEKNFMDLGLILDNEEERLEVYEGDESDFPSLNKEETELLETLVMGWLKEKGAHRSFHRLNGTLFWDDAQDKDLDFCGQALTWEDAVF